MVQEKKVVDEVSGWFRIYNDGSVERSWTGPPEVNFMLEPVSPHTQFIEAVATRDITTTTTHDGLIHRARIYLPEKTPKDNHKLPILIHFHGGGFCISEPDWFMYYHVYTRFVRSTRSICVSPFLRRAPEHRLPAAIDDGFTTLQWLQSVARGDVSDPWLEEHGDFSRVFLIGDSSGGNLVHEVAARVGSIDLSPIWLAGAIPIHPGFVRSYRSKSELEMPQSPFLTLDMMDKFLRMALPIGSNKDHPITCPMGEAAPPLDGLKLPPFLLCVAEKDLLNDTQMEFYEAMKKANKDVDLFVSKGMTHSFYLNKMAVDLDHNVNAEMNALIGRVKEFIENH
ncbi:strigolactones hydrolase CXE15-like [Cicer arietinum]|uniref:Probable carboxylesterase 15 n=1 Tax=Cicer arietinum TaxID=3827 RepID=A0A1S2Y5K0_CICAR|nr:probable carboxylesterase 15 [Cicer arietinum]